MVKSINPNTQQEHTIPEILDDRSNINAFLENHSDKKVIAVQGLGFVGAVMSLVCANSPGDNYVVIGVDLPRPDTFWKIQSINTGHFPIVASDPKVEAYYQRTRTKKNFYATYDPYAYSLADVIIVDINLDVAKNSNFDKTLESYNVDLTGFKMAMKSIGDVCKPDALVLVETTVPPGTCAKIVQPIISQCLESRDLPTDQIKIGHSYERVMPGPNYIDSIQNFYRVYSGIDNHSADAVEAFLRTIISTDEYPLTRLGNTNATEMAKVLENSYRAMNIAFAGEWTRFAEEANVNLYEVIKAIRMRPTHANLMYPGIGVGGYCLTKDPLLASWARQNLFDSPDALAQSERGVELNDKMPIDTFQFLKKEYGSSLAQKKVLILGVSYRGDVGDTRYTPVESFYDWLLKEESEVVLTDPLVPYWEEKKMPIETDFNKVLSTQYDIVVIATGHTEYRSNRELNEWLMSQNTMMILDTVGLFNEEEIKRLSTLHTVRVVGRGDIK